MEPRAERSIISYPVRNFSMRVTRSVFSTKRCTARVMLLRSGTLKSEGRWKIFVSDDIQDEKEILLVIHVDDFLVVASQDALD